MGALVSNFDASNPDASAEEIKASPEAMAAFDKFAQSMGYEKPTTPHQAMLPPALQNFTPLKEVPNVATILSDVTFVAAQNAVQKAPTDAAALDTLRTQVATLLEAYKVALAARLEEDQLKSHCRTVIRAGNDDISRVYENVWGLTVHGDPEGVELYRKAVHQLIATSQEQMLGLEIPGIPAATPPLVVARTCDSGHALIAYVTPGGTCSMCNSRQDSGTEVMACDACNYWICPACLTAPPPTADGSKETTTKVKALRQVTPDVSELYQHGGQIHGTYTTIMLALVEGMEGVQSSIPLTLKNMGRLVEKW